jgi:hypothetical protein
MGTHDTLKEAFKVDRLRAKLRKNLGSIYMSDFLPHYL